MRNFFWRFVYSWASVQFLIIYWKTLVHLSNVLKTNGNPFSLPAALRANMVKLTNHAEEVAVLLPFSSVTQYTPHYSPVSDSQRASHNATSYPLEETQLLAGLSRSRSEQPTLRPRAPLASHGNNAFSKSTGVRRPRQLRETSTCHLEPGWSCDFFKIYSVDSTFTWRFWFWIQV